MWIYERMNVLRVMYKVGISSRRTWRSDATTNVIESKLWDWKSLRYFTLL